MFGLAILFFLALWAVGTLLAMYLCGMVGSKLGAKVGLPLVGGLFGVALGFTLPMGRVFLGWAQEKIDAETMVAGLCATKAGIRIYLSPEEHARRIRENDWEGVKRAEVKDRDLGSITLGKVVTLDGKKFSESDEAIAGKYGDLIPISEYNREEYPRSIAYASNLYYDVVHKVPLFLVRSFMVTRIETGPKLKFWWREWYGCHLAIDEKSNRLLEKYKPSLRK